MNIGVSTACFYPLETEVALEDLGKAGVKNAEIFFNADCELKDSFIDMLIDIKNEYGINVSSVHPASAFTESFVFFSAYERRFTEGIQNYCRYSEIAAKLGAKYIIMHGGKLNSVLSDEEYCERFMRIKEAVRKNGVTVLQENVLRLRAGDIEFLKSIRNILGDEAEMCLDIKQALRCGYDPYELIDLFYNNIKHYHISDHNLSSDCLLPGRGGFDFGEFFKRLKSFGYNGSCIIEVYNNAYNDYSEIYRSYEFLQQYR